jgi:hypothetical protein
VQIAQPKKTTRSKPTTSSRAPERMSLPFFISIPAPREQIPEVASIYSCLGFRFPQPEQVSDPPERCKDFYFLGGRREDSRKSSALIHAVFLPPKNGVGLPSAKWRSQGSNPCHESPTQKATLIRRHNQMRQCTLLYTVALWWCPEWVSESGGR